MVRVAPGFRETRVERGREERFEIGACPVECYGPFSGAVEEGGVLLEYGEGNFGLWMFVSLKV